MRRPPRATLMSAGWLNFPSAHCVDTLGQVTFDTFMPSRMGLRSQVTPAASNPGISPMPALTSDIAEFVTSVEAGPLPERCSYGARIGMVDCVGVMIAGAG